MRSREASGPSPCSIPPAPVTRGKICHIGLLQGLSGGGCGGDPHRGGKGNEIRERVHSLASARREPQGEEVLWEWLSPKGVLRVAVPGIWHCQRRGGSEGLSELQFPSVEWE